MLFQHGNLRESEDSALRAASQLQRADPIDSARFTLVAAESAFWTEDFPRVLTLLSRVPPETKDLDLEIQRHSLAGITYGHLHRFQEADKELSQAIHLCASQPSLSCSELLRSLGGLAIERGQPNQAFQYYEQSLASARRYRQPFDEATALMNLGHACLLTEKFDQAIDWSHAAQTLATQVNAQDVLQVILGNLGWAYYSLGDGEKALGLFQQAEQRAVAIGDTGAAILWLKTTAHVYQDDLELARAEENFTTALTLARQLDSKQDIVDILEDLAHVSAQDNKLDQAASYLHQLRAIIALNDNPVDEMVIALAQAEIDAARHQNSEAQKLFLKVEQNPASQISMRMGAEHQLAKLLESQSKLDQAGQMYRTALTTFETGREQLDDETSKLPYLTNASSIYDDYIDLLIRQNKPIEALAIADHSRANTLAQGLGQQLQHSLTSAASSPQSVARKADATMLFYWLGKDRSYLWAANSAATTMYLLPPKRDIISLVSRYRNSLIGPGQGFNDEIAGTLFKILVSPAIPVINPHKPVMILTDGELSQLNFETLLVPGPTPHYWIEDATLEAAPSLAMLAAARSSQLTDKRLLLLGDAISADENYPELPNAAEEVKLIPRHFPANNVTAFTRQQANPSAYFSSKPERYAYIHFVAHGVASRTDPLDSAIILSQPASAQSSFKLYAREIMRHPIDARLVTISACYGTGIRAYAGEGLVGLSWAFLRAGAHNTIGAMWEASDDSTPHLMDTMYQAIEQGQSPASALRAAKLSLLHSHTIYQKPFYWAPFQLYTRR